MPSGIWATPQTVATVACTCSTHTREVMNIKRLVPIATVLVFMSATDSASAPLPFADSNSETALIAKYFRSVDSRPLSRAHSGASYSWQ